MKRPLKPETLLSELESVASRLFTEVRRDEGQFSTGVCRIKDKTLLVLNTRQPTVERISALAREIARHNADKLYLKPAVREEIEHYAAMAQTQPAAEENYGY